MAENEITVKLPDEPPPLTPEVARILWEILSDFHEKQKAGKLPPPGESDD